MSNNPENHSCLHNADEDFDYLCIECWNAGRNDAMNLVRRVIGEHQFEVYRFDQKLPAMSTTYYSEASETVTVEKVWKKYKRK